MHMNHVTYELLFSFQVLPAYADDLTLEEPSSRIIAIKLLGTVTFTKDAR
jgi:hypothetical protein